MANGEYNNLLLSIRHSHLLYQILRYKPYCSVFPNGLSLDISPEFNSFLRPDRSFCGLALTIYNAIIVLPTY